MSKTVAVKTTIQNSSSKDITNNFDIIVANELIGQTFEIEYVPLADGGPLMRPKLPPT